MADAAPRYRLTHVRTLSFAERTGRFSDNPAEAPTVSYAPSFGFTFDEERRSVSVLVFIEALHLEDDADEPTPGTEPLAEVEVGCMFEFESLDPFRVEEGIQMPRQMVAQLIGIALSSARGILIGRTVHPVFQEAPLPVVSPMAFVASLVESHELAWVAPE